MSLLKELKRNDSTQFYKYFAPNEAKNELDKRSFFT